MPPSRPTLSGKGLSVQQSVSRMDKSLCSSSTPCVVCSGIKHWPWQCDKTSGSKKDINRYQEPSCLILQSCFTVSCHQARSVCQSLRCFAKFSPGLYSHAWILCLSWFICLKSKLFPNSSPVLIFFNQNRSQKLCTCETITS